MQIHGFNKTTLLDYPGHLAATIFLGGCNFRCPFCHNSGLVLDPGSEPVIPEDEVLSYLKKRRGILEGVCITGGEPSLESGLADFLRKIKELGYKIKLDTNGYRPETIEALLAEHLLDHIAMDIKSSPEGYPLASGIKDIDIGRIDRSIFLIMNSGIDYEFRTTVVKELHSAGDMESIGHWLKGCQAYYLQNYKDSESVISPGFHSCTREELENFRNILLKNMEKVELRGVD
ncbi:anaerobic ribonucleoside-triphosphate reductase activating protein [Anaerobium acetethylicum]|uniref:Pyruvate formate lyase activating enzyme n=1 Tax=Anaerobium acetethylicum TaxID=1619234 RepID=A0A1D3TXX8_9FIRM|nr:anaerobic ribonucleoside-triphosphate reductase activating protein [Anaerobium acetethylicum]SCP99233.1 pyruvate formate lyase activating enzyme [Anaerobium acetethylicum]